MLVKDYLRPAAVAVAVISKAYAGRYGYHNLRQGLSTYLVNAGVNPKVVQGLLRHERIQTTLDLYTDTVDDSAVAAQGLVMEKLVKRELLKVPANGKSDKKEPEVVEKKMVGTWGFEPQTSTVSR